MTVSMPPRPGDLAGEPLEALVERVLRLKGYHVERDVTLAGTQVDMLAHTSDGLSDTTFVVECNGGARPVGIQMVKEKFADVADLADETRILRLLFVASSGFTREARDYARPRARLLLRSLSELETEIIDLRPLRNAYVYAYENNMGVFAEADLHASYIPLSATKDAASSDPLDLMAATLAWLRGEHNLLFILGEYGSGKTSFVRHFCYELLRQEEPDVYPVLISLRDFNSAAHIKELITDALVNSYGVRLPSFFAFDAMAKAGRILMVFDGLDEMMAASNSGATTASLAQFHALAAIGARVIVTCRTNYFTNNEHLLSFVRGMQVASGRNAGSAGTPDSNANTFEGLSEVLAIAPFDGHRIGQYIAKHHPDPTALMSEIADIHDLSDLCTRPVLLRMVVETLPTLLTEGTAKINSASLYEAYVKQWTSRDDWRGVLESTTRMAFCQALASRMYRSSVATIPYSALEGIVRGAVEASAGTSDQVEQFVRDVQVCSFLVRSGTGDEFAFAHKSFVEFFVARTLASILLSDDPAIGQEFSVMDEVVELQHSDSFSWARYMFDVPSSFHVSAEGLLASRYPILLDRASSAEIPGLLAFLAGSLEKHVRVRRDLEEDSFQDPLVKALRDAVLSSWAPDEQADSPTRKYLLRKLAPTSAHGYRVTAEVATFTIELLALRDFAPRMLFAALDDPIYVSAWTSILDAAASCSITGSPLATFLAGVASPDEDFVLTCFSYLGRCGALDAETILRSTDDDTIFNRRLAGLCVRGGLTATVGEDLRGSARLNDIGLIALEVSAGSPSRIPLQVVDRLLATDAAEPRALGAAALAAISSSPGWLHGRVEEVILDEDLGLTIRLAAVGELPDGDEVARMALRLSGRVRDPRLRSALLRKHNAPKATRLASFDVHRRRTASLAEFVIRGPQRGS